LENNRSRLYSTQGLSYLGFRRKLSGGEEDRMKDGRNDKIFENYVEMSRRKKGISR
jgi:hypothetical protein